MHSAQHRFDPPIAKRASELGRSEYVIIIEPKFGISLKRNYKLKKNLLLSFPAGVHGAKQLYQNAERISRKCVIWISAILLSYSAFGLVIPAILYSWYCMWKANFDVSTWYTLYDTIVPFDTTTVIGWYLQFVFIHLPFPFMYCLVLGGIISHFLSCCLYIRAGCENIRLLVRAADVDVKKYKLVEIVKLHCKILE